MIRRDCYTALTFNGTSQRVDAASALALTSFTLACWVRRTKAPSIQPLIAGGAGSACLQLNVNNGLELTKIGTGIVGVASPNEIAPRAEYVHVGATYDGTTVRLYVNGVQVVSAVAAQTFSSSVYSAATDGTNWFGGTLDEVVVYGRALTPAEMFVLMDRGPSDVRGALIDWRFDEAVGAVALDSSGNGNNGAIVGAVYSRIIPRHAAFVQRNLGYAANFNGTNARIDLDSLLTNTVLANAPAVTVSFWMRYLTPWQNGRLFSAYTSSSSVALMVWVTGSAATQQLAFTGRSAAADSSVAVTLTPILEPGNWMHVAGVFDYQNKLLSAYVNGVLRGTAAAGAWSRTTFETSNNGGAIGAFSGGDWFRGQLDDVRVYKRALTQAEIRRAYLNGQWPDAPPALLWTFDDATATNTGTDAVGVTPLNMSYLPSLS